MLQTNGPRVREVEVRIIHIHDTLGVPGQTIDPKVRMCAHVCGQCAARPRCLRYSMHTECTAHGGST